MVTAFLPEQVDADVFPARVTLGDVVLATRSWQWSFASGAASPEMRLVVDNLVDEKIRALEGPQRLRCKGSPLNGRDDVTFEHERVYLLDRHRISPWEVRYVVADQRRRLRDVMVGGRFNVTRRANTLDSAQQPDALGIFEALNTIRRYRYVPHTMQDRFADPPRFARIPPGGDVRADQGKPWTAFEIVRWLLTAGYRAGGFAEETIDLVLDDDVKDNGHVEEDVVFGVAGEKFASVLDRFLNLARLGLYVDERSRWVVYDLAAPPITAKVGGYPGAGTLAKEDLSRVRPAETVWRCGALHEVLIHQPDEDTAARNPSLNDLMTVPENVGVLPAPVEVDGVRYERGEYLTIAELIAAYNKLGWPTGKTLTIGLLRKGYLGRAMLFREFCQLSTGRFDVAAVNRMEALRNAYRRVWRLPQPLLDSVVSWEAARAARLDAVTGQRMPSPVWCDFVVMPTGKAKITRGQTDPEQSTNVLHPTQITDLDDGDPSPFGVSVIDHDLGIFSVDTNTPDPSGRVDLFVLGQFEEPISMLFADLIRAGTYETAELAEDFKFSTIISVRFAPPEGGPSPYALKAAASEFGVTDATGPRYEVRELREVARYRWVPGKTEIVESPNGHAQVRDAELMNRAALTALARAAGQRVYWSFADRWIGRYERPRYEAGVDRPRGNAQTVTVRFEAGRLTTTYTLPEGAPPPDLYELLPASVRQEYYRQIGRGA